MGSWLDRWRRRSRQTRLRARAQTVRPWVEQLDDRCLPSAGFVQSNLVSDLPGLARFTDPNLINPWGLAYSPTGPFWVSNAYAGDVSVFTGSGDLVPLGPFPAVGVSPGSSSPRGSLGIPTGVVFNGGPDFAVSAWGRSAPSLFLFATEDGTLAGWSPGVDFGHAIVAVDNSGTGAVYKGLAIGTDSQGHTFLYAADFGTGTVDVFDEDFHAVRASGAFVDPTLPSGFAPFGIQDLNGRLYVTYARQDAARQDDVAGPGNGFVDVFSTDGVFEGRLISGGPLDSPWGLALAPAGFGSFGGDLLVGNVGDGHINAFDPRTGRFLGSLADARGRPIAIDHLWGLEFGNGAFAGGTETLYFSGGIDDERHGLFGALRMLGANDAPANLPPLVYEEPGQSDGTDNYPVPPVGGPTPRDEAVPPSRPLPLTLPLKDPPPVLTRADANVLQGPGVLAAPPASEGLAVGGSTGNRLALPVALRAPDEAASPGLVSESSLADQTDGVVPERLSALELLLALRTEPESGTETSGREFRTEAFPSPQQNDRAAEPAERGAETAPSVGWIETTVPVAGCAVHREQDRGRRSRPLYTLAAVLITGGVFVTWGVRYSAHGTHRKQS